MKIFIAVLVLLYTVGGAAIFIFQKQMIYYPDGRDFMACPEFLDSQKIDMDGTRAYYKENSQNLVVFYHGNANSACDRAYLKDDFEKLGLSYLFVEYAGYSGGGAEPSKELLMKDARNAAAFIAKQNFSQVFVTGESLGTALAVYHSTIATIDRLLLVSPFYRMADMASINFGIYPTSLMLTENYDSGEWMRQSKAKAVEIIHGAADSFIPISQARNLFAATPVANKKILEVKGAGHNDIFTFEETRAEINTFLGN